MFFQIFWAASHSLCGILLAKNVVRSHAGIMELDTSHQNIQCKCSSLPGARSWRTHAENWAAFQYRPAVAKNDSAPTVIIDQEEYIKKVVKDSGMHEANQSMNPNLRVIDKRTSTMDGRNSGVLWAKYCGSNGLRDRISRTQ